MNAILIASPILPGKLEAWRRFCQELQGTRHGQYVESRRRLGIVSEVAWHLSTDQFDVALVYLEAKQPEQVFPKLAASGHPFDRWLKRQMMALYGLDLNRPTTQLHNELVFEWHDGCQQLNVSTEEDI